VAVPVHSLWKGALSFGLVTIPVRMYAATQSRDVHFRYLHASCLAPVEYRKVCSACGQEVSPAEIALGVANPAGGFVTLSAAELAELPAGSARTVEIERFVPDGAVDAVFFAKAYYLEPDAGGQKAYALLARAMRQERRSAVVRITLRRRERWALVRAGTQGLLLLETLFDADEVRSPAGLDLPPSAEVRPAEEEMARHLIGALAAEFRPEENPDRYRQALEALVARKTASGPTPPGMAPAAASNLVDLMEALRASLAAREGSAAEVASAPKPRAPRRRTGRGKGAAAEDAADGGTAARAHAGKGG
jgi:DNA end-binding protein Ku